MNNFREIIQKIENRTGEKFDYSNRRHKSLLSSNVNRIINEKNRIESDVMNVFEGYKTYDPAQQKPILRADRKK